MPHGKPTSQDIPSDDEPAAAPDIDLRAPTATAYEPIAQDDEWLEEPEELPRRPRRRLLTPLPLALLGVLLVACGFIGGVLVEKGQSSSSSSSTGSGAGAGLAARFRALRAGAAGAGSGSAGGSSSASSGFTRPTAGTVAYLSGETLYVTNDEGNTIKVTTSPATSVTKTVAGTVKGIHPGETVTVTGTTGSDGAVSAESISVGSSGGGLAALFGGASGSSGSSSRARGGGSEGPALFGPG